MISEKIETFGFMFLESSQSQLIKLEGLGLETRKSNYFFNNISRLNDSYLFQYTLEGKGRVTINGKEHLLGKNQGFFCRLPSHTSYGVTENDDAWRFLWINISGSVADNFFREINDKYEGLITLKEDSAAIHTLKHLYSLSKNRQINSCALSQELAFSFLCRLSASLNQPEQTLSALTRKATEIIARDYASLAGVSDVAQRLGVSQEHLSRTFKKETGKQLIDSLTKTKLIHVIELLRKNELTLDKIALKCGFSSGNYMGKVFKHYVGISPKMFKKDPTYSQYSDIVIFN